MRRHGWVLIVPAILLLVLYIFINEVSPLNAGPAGILFVFGLLYGAFLSLTFSLIYFGQRVISRFGLLRERDHMHSRKAYYVASVLACLPLFLLAINTIGRLAFSDVLLVGLFIALATFYVLKRT